MRKSQLRRLELVCREHLRVLETSVDLRAIATVQHLCQVLARQRQRPIHLEAYPLPPLLAGVWLGSQTTDYIFYADDAPPLLQEHIVLHELAHMLLGLQEAIPVDFDHDEEHGGVPPLPRTLVLTALKRSCYDNEHERMAEVLASLIEQRWRAARRASRDLIRQPVALADMRWLADYMANGR